mgnify:CR=1 FL=1
MTFNNHAQATKSFEYVRAHNQVMGKLDYVEPKEEITVDRVISAVGVVGNVEGLGLEKHGVKTDRGTIVTDPYGKTNVAGVYAIGDVAGPAHISGGPEDYAGRGQRLWVVDIRDGIPRNVYLAEEGELVTHESWWINDQILFCGGKSPASPEVSHVKVLNIYTGEVRIAGAGAWWPGAPASEAARLNWWHAAGSANGRWIVAEIGRAHV